MAFSYPIRCSMTGRRGEARWGFLVLYKSSAGGGGGGFGGGGFGGGGGSFGGGASGGW